MIKNDWDEILKDEYNKDYFLKLMNRVNNEYNLKKIYPLRKDLFKAFQLSSYQATKVVILGQDPYHGPNQAHGLSFSVETNIKIPPSLKNIYKELKNDVGIEKNDGNLEKWAKQGVLLINSIMSVEESKPSSHKNIGWEQFTDNIIKILNEKDQSIVFILWGNYAKEKEKYITSTKHLVLKASHPSPFSARNGFFGSKPFSKTNEFLLARGLKQIEW